MFKLPPAPRMSGGVLRSVVAATSAEPVRRALVAVMRKDMGIEAARALPPSARSHLPLHVLPEQGRPPRRAVSRELELPRAPSALISSRSWSERYAAGASVTAVIERVFAESRRLEGATPTMACLSAPDPDRAIEEAAASEARWLAGEPLGPLDGVPIAIKEEVDIDGHGYRLGTSFHPARSDAVDATVVRRLRAAGAIIIGHACMTEMGMSPLGVNIHRKMPRNVHAADRLAGGSSTGSAVAVGSGLCPVALGSDGGGSIRIPSAFNGLFGLKPTFGRVSRQGDGFGGSVDHLGPIGASTHDLALLLDATCGPDPEDWLTSAASEVDDWFEPLGRGVDGLRIGVLRDEIAAADDAVASACIDALAALEADGAVLVDVELPLAQHASGIGYLTIGLETYASLLDARRSHWDSIGPDLQLLCRLLSSFSSDDYLDAQALRATLRAQTADRLRHVDLLAMPTTQSVAPTVTQQELERGFADTPALHAACRFAFLGNLTGLPCGTAPVGSGEAGLPAGLQLVGDAFDEPTVLQALAQLERAGVAMVREPRIPAHPFGRA